jgi:hypothetical protein
LVKEKAVSLQKLIINMTKKKEVIEVKEDSTFISELLKHKEELEKAIEQAVGNLNFLQGQKAYNQALIDKYGKEKEKENVLEPGN